MSAIYMLDGKPHRECDCSFNDSICPLGRIRSCHTAGFNRCMIPADNVIVCGDIALTINPAPHAAVPTATPSELPGLPEEPPVIFTAGKWSYQGDATTPPSEHDSRELDAAAWHKLRSRLVEQGEEIERLKASGDRHFKLRIEAELRADRAESALREAREKERERCIQEVIKCCGACGGTGYTVAIKIVPGHDCGGDDKLCQTRCPVPVPVQEQHECEYCGIPAQAIRSMTDEQK
jgi:hypothetical protein